MDAERFDLLAKEFSRIGSRRAVVQALAGVTAGGLLALLGGRRAGAAGETVLICHKTTSDTNAVVLIEVSHNAVPDHLAHGDFPAVNGSCQETCLGLGAVCETNNECCQDEPSNCEAVRAGCGDSEVQQCCHPGGSCTDDCDCCGSLLCNENSACDNDPGSD